MLNLSSYVNTSDTTLHSRSMSILERPQFASNSYLGNIGAPLSMPDQSEEDEGPDEDED